MISKEKKFIYIHIIKCGGTSIEEIIEPHCCKVVRPPQADTDLDIWNDCERLPFTYCSTCSFIHCINGTFNRYNVHSNDKGFEDHSFMSEVHKVLTNKEYNTYYKFTVVRHPLTKIASLWDFTDGFRVDTCNAGTPTLATGWWQKDWGMTFPNFIQNLPKLCKESRKAESETGSYMFSPQVEWLKVNNKIKLDKIIHLENLNSEWKDIAYKLNLDFHPNHPVHGIGKKRSSNKTTTQYLSLYTQELKDIVYDVYKEDMEEFNFEIL